MLLRSIEGRREAMGEQAKPGRFANWGTVALFCFWLRLRSLAAFDSECLEQGFSAGKGPVEALAFVGIRQITVDSASSKRSWGRARPSCAFSRFVPSRGKTLAWVDLGGDLPSEARDQEG